MAAPRRLVRFLAQNTGGVVLGDLPLSSSKPISAKLVKGCGPWRPGGARGLTVSPSSAVIESLLCPVPIPPAVFCIGLNYKKHAAETGLPEPRFPVVFMKNPASVTGPEENIVVPTVAADPLELDYEGELAIVIGPRPVKNVSKAEALNYVLGYTAANDVSARRWQGKKGGSQWSYSKSFDTFCPLGPGLLLEQSDVDPDNLRITTRLNGEVVQDSNTSDMIFDVRSLISFLSQSTTLLPGSVILTGTPEGVGFTRNPPLFMRPGDSVEVELEGAGILRNMVVAEPAGTGPEETRVWSHAEGKMIDP